MPKVPLDLLYERLAAQDPDTLLEMLHISTDDLLTAFKSRIKIYQEELSSELDVDIEQAFNVDDDNTFDNYDSNNFDDFIIEEGKEDE